MEMETKIERECKYYNGCETRKSYDGICPYDCDIAYNIMMTDDDNDAS